jgi:amino acid adenylation domain-containing protein/thioester reductase-like protein
MSKQRDEIEAIYPLSPMQQGMLFHSLSAPEFRMYFQQLNCQIRGRLNVAAFQAAWQQVMERHPILRTLFLWERRKEPLQVVRKTVKLPWQFHNWQGLPRSEQHSRLRAFLEEDRRQDLDLTKAPVMRLALFQTAPDEYHFVWTTHHILLDGSSQPILLNEVMAFYQAAGEGVTLQLPQPRPFRDYIAWLQQQDLTRDESYWRNALHGISSPTPLVVDRPTSGATQQAASDARQTLVFSEATTAALRTLARQHQLTRNTLIQAVWAILLSRYSGQQDVVFGTLVSGRPAELAGAETMVGLFINTLPVRVQIEPDAPLLPWLGALQAQQVELRQHEHTPLTQIQSWSEIPRGTPLFESVLAFNNYWMGTSVDEREADLDIVPEALSQTISYPLVVVVSPLQALEVEVAYDSRRFDAATITQLLGHFQTLLESIIANPQQRLGDLPLLTAAEQQLLVEWNQTAAPFERQQTLHDLFEAQVAPRPDAIAAVFQGQSLSYRELDQRANQLARALQALNVGPETLVGICVERSLELVVAILGVLKAGGAYVPLDPAYPRERLAFMIEDARLPVLLTQASLLDQLPDHQAQVVCLDRDWPAIARHEPSAPPSGATPQNLAYVIYTSGSTGRPKGTLVTHYGVANLSAAQRHTFGLRPENQVLQFSSLSFDASVFETVMALCTGATLHLSTAENLLPGPDLLALLRERAITNITFPPSALATLPQASLPALQTIAVAGEACPPDLVARWAPGRAFFNLYGPTESTIWATAARCSDGEQKPPIGRPILNTQIYLLDSRMRPVPVGVPGEIYIGGVGLARGYLNRPGLTAERFVPNPFGQTPGERLYRSGDLARYLPDGNLDFLGRIDHQVKVRGFRIELGEIEAVLGQHPTVREAVVSARVRSISDAELVAYFVPYNEAPPASELRQFLKTRLPDYMVPSLFFSLDALPLTPNGKVDRRALPAFDAAQRDSGLAFVAPRTPTESKLAEVWAGVLGRERVGIHDNFFESGGHSLLVTQLAFQIREAFQVDLPLNRLLVTPTIAEIAEAITAIQQGGSAAPAERSRPLDLKAEALLDPAIPAVPPPLVARQPAHIFLTGATGFLGAFLLAELLQQTDAHVHALVRADTPTQGQQRLKQTLKNYQLWDERWHSHITPILGDLALPRLGLSPTDFERLAAQIDVIYHNGALVNFVQPYQMLKAANVLGTQEVLRLAGTTRLKPVHFISTLSIFSPLAARGVATIREDQPLAHPEGLEGGYEQTKWVAERLINLAKERGIPVAVYRPGRITGHSQTGAGSTDDFFYRMLKGCIQLGSVPDAELPVDMVPVDYVARAIVFLSTQPASLGKAFHLTNPAPIAISDLVAWIRSFGYTLEQLPYETWQARLLNNAGQSDENALYPLLATFASASAGGETGPQQAPVVPHFDCQNTVNGLRHSNIACPPVDTTLLNTYFTYFIRSGFLSAPEPEKAVGSPR